MPKRGAVVLAGCSALICEDAARVLEDAGYMVVRAHTLDYALAANELFAPKAVVMDTRRIDGDIPFFCRALACRPNHPEIFLVGEDGEEAKGTMRLPKNVQCLRSPLLLTELVARLNVI